MTTGLKRIYGSSHLHFITCSCYRRQPLLHADDRYESLLTTLETVRQRYQFLVGGYVVMPEPGAPPVCFSQVGELIGDHGLDHLIELDLHHAVFPIHVVTSAAPWPISR
ncbi:MAG: hypothetical protein JWN45_1539 [Acidobacteriaceae bacterium]|nr:hypothetical protein [Acidobacteriaceae bacterium]